MKRLKYIILTIVIIAAIVITLLINKQNSASKTKMISAIDTDIAVKTEIVSDSTYSFTFSSIGTVEARRELQFSSDMPGRIVNIYTDAGKHVTKGDILIQLDDEMLRTDVKSSQATFDALKKDFERFKNANQQGGVTEQQLDNIRTQMIAAESRYTTALRRLADAAVKAPISGVINKRYIEIGSYINPGTALFDIIDDSELKIKCFVNEKQLINIEQGQAVKISSDMTGDEIISGIVTFIGDKADRSLNFPVEIKLTNQNKQLKAGIFVKAQFKSLRTKRGIIVPRSAIVGSVQSTSVYIIKNDTAFKRNVVIGDIIDEKVEIISGLNNGDTIAIAGIVNLSNKAKVKLSK